MVEALSAGFSLVSPVQPSRGLRGDDAFGSGAFAARRLHGGHEQPHKGLDFAAEPGDRIINPCNSSAILTHLGLAYPDSDLGSIHLHVVSNGFTIKLLYVTSGCRLAQTFGPGDLLGASQDVAAYHLAKKLRSDPSFIGLMVNHCHLELYDADDNLLNPNLFLKAPTP